MNWKLRESERFNSGQYKRIVWFEKGILEEIPDHFAHLSNKTPGLISYTPDDEKGEKDIQIVTRPGKYLTKFYPHLDKVQVRDMAAMVEDESIELLIATTPEEIEEIYVKGPRSCMSAKEDVYASQVHPVRVYGGKSDIKLAYLRKAGKITARALVWPEKKRCGRLYGDYNRLWAMLEEQGYERRPFFGAKLNTIFEEYNGSQKVVCPYIDDARYVKFNKDQELVIVGGAAKDKIMATNTNGYAYGSVCAGCKKWTDARKVQDLNAYLCEPCRNEKDVYCCYYSGEYYTPAVPSTAVYVSSKDIRIISEPYTKYVWRSELSNRMIYSRKYRYRVDGKVYTVASWEMPKGIKHGWDDVFYLKAEDDPGPEPVVEEPVVNPMSGTFNGRLDYSTMTATNNIYLDYVVNASATAYTWVVVDRPQGETESND